MILKDLIGKYGKKFYFIADKQAGTHVDYMIVDTGSKDVIAIVDLTDGKLARFNTSDNIIDLHIVELTCKTKEKKA